MTSSFAETNGIKLCYEEFGAADDPVLLLIMGVGEQLIAFPDGFCELLAGHGFRVIRFDNRDVGRSTWLDELGDVDLAGLMSGDLSTVRYGLADLVADTAGLLDALDVARAHLVGVSMGGGIAQQLAIDHPRLVASLASIMATPSDRVSGGSSLTDPTALVPAAGVTREEAIAADVALYRLIGSPGFPAGDEELTRRAAAKVDRAYHPAGTLRHIAANAVATDRTEGLRTLTVPTVVIHGDSDPLVNVSGGRATADAVPGARLLVIPGMGHDLPEGAWHRIADAVVANARAASDHPIVRVLEDLSRVAAAITPEQHTLPTPSAGLDVLGLRRHLTGGLIYFEEAFREPAAPNDGADPHAYAGPDDLDAVLTRLIATLRTALAAGVETTVVNVPHLGGSFPGSVVVNLLLLEVVTHGWELARATGRPWQPDEATAAQTLAFYRVTIKPEWRGPGMAFGPEVPVADDAPTIDRVVAFAGRDPGWIGR